VLQTALHPDLLQKNKRKIESIDRGSYELESACHDENENGVVDRGEQFPRLSSVDDRSYKDSDECPLCSATFTTQEVGTPDTCDHIFCVACLQEWSKNESTCPVDHRKFSFMYVRNHIGGEIITKIKLEPPNEQGRYYREDVEAVGAKLTLDHCMCMLSLFLIIMFLHNIARHIGQPILNALFQALEEMTRNSRQ
jgi:hypothetical protein